MARRIKPIASPEAIADSTRSATGALGRSTRQRRTILAIIASEARPLSPVELHELAQGELPQIGLSTIYRNIRALEHAGEIRAVDIPGQPPRYEPAAVAAHHHHHFHCTECDRVYDLHGCPGGLRDLLPRGFTLQEHTIVLSGHCERCSGDTPKSVR